MATTSSSKVPEVTFVFWIIKIAATTLGETGGDAVTMSMDLGYLLGTAIFALVFAVAVYVQIASTRFVPALYWVAIIASTTVGTTLADFADRSLGIGYVGGAAMLAGLLAVTLGVWHRALGTISVASVASPQSESFYWLAIMFSQTLGTAIGDATADDLGLGYDGAALVFGAALVAVAGVYRWTRASRTLLFWAAFVLTRPLGAALGDFIDKPVDAGGLALSRYAASATLLALIALLVVAVPQRPAERAH